MFDIFIVSKFPSLLDTIRLGRRTRYDAAADTVCLISRGELGPVPFKQLLTTAAPVPTSRSPIASHKRSSAPKVSEANAENRVMDKEQGRRLIVDEQLHADARALAISIETIRRARGKKNPRDVDFGTPEWKNTCIEFARDLRWALGIGDDGLTEVRRPDNP